MVNQLAGQTLASLTNNTVIQGGAFTNLRAETCLWYRDSLSVDRFVLADSLACPILGALLPDTNADKAVSTGLGVLGNALLTNNAIQA